MFTILFRNSLFRLIKLNPRLFLFCELLPVLFLMKFCPEFPGFFHVIRRDCRWELGLVFLRDTDQYNNVGVTVSTFVIKRHRQMTRLK